MTDDVVVPATRRRVPAVLPAVGGVGVLGVVIFGLFVARSASFTAAELEILRWLNDHHTAALDVVATTIAVAFGPPGAIAITAFGALVVVTTSRSLSRALAFVAIVGLVWGVNFVVKQLVRRPRPDTGDFVDPVNPAHGFSYPSGHTAFTAGLVIAIAFTWWFVVSVWTRRLIVIGGVLLVFLAAASRTYLGVHYPSDVSAAVVCAASSALIWITVIANTALPRARRCYRPVRS